MSIATVMPHSLKSAGAALRDLRAVVLLGGTVRPGRLASSIGRAVFELPVDQSSTILDGWRRQTWILGQSVGRSALPVRVMVDRASIAPDSAPETEELAPLRVERDPFDYRGTGGVLRDLAVEYADEDVLMVANAAQVLMEPLDELAHGLAKSGGEVTIVSHEDGTPSGVLLIRCRALRELPAAGFVDMKEQALPAIARSHDVRVLRRERPSGLPVRTLDDYIEALATYHRRASGRMKSGSAYAEDWESTFALIEDGAFVNPSARVHDAVVLKGGRLEAESVLVHSIVCPGGVLARGEKSMDSLVTAGSNRRARKGD